MNATADTVPLTFDCSGEMRVVNGSVGGWRVTTFEEALARDRPTFDRVYAAGRGDRVELAVLDGAVNAADPDGPAKTAAALDVTLDAIAAHVIGRGLEVAANAIHDPAQKLRHRSGLVAFSGIELAGDTAMVWRLADVEAWVLLAGDWQQVLPGDMLTGAARKRYEDAVAGAGLAQAFAVQEVVLDDLGGWRYPTLGLDAVSHATPVIVHGVSEVIIASDGLMMNRDRAAEFADWAARSIHQKRAGHRHRSAHGDLAAVWACRTPTAG